MESFLLGFLVHAALAGASWGMLEYMQSFDKAFKMAGSPGEGEVLSLAFPQFMAPCLLFYMATYLLSKEGRETIRHEREMAQMKRQKREVRRLEDLQDTGEAQLSYEGDMELIERIEALEKDNEELISENRHLEGEVNRSRGNDEQFRELKKRIDELQSAIGKINDDLGVTMDAVEEALSKVSSGSDDGSSNHDPEDSSDDSNQGGEPGKLADDPKIQQREVEAVFGKTDDDQGPDQGPGPPPSAGAVAVNESKMKKGRSQKRRRDEMAEIAERVLDKERVDTYWG